MSDSYNGLKKLIIKKFNKSSEVTNVLADVEKKLTDTTIEELQKEISAFQKSVLELIKAGEIKNKSDAEDLAHTMKKATQAISETSPQKSRIMRSLKGATEILEEGAKIAKAAGNLKSHIIKLAFFGAALWALIIVSSKKILQRPFRT